nr:cytochrome b5 domain-containing protein [Agrilactobacillus composti]
MMDKTFTKTELAQYDGQDGRKKYVAIDGVVYDLTGFKAWASNNHHGNHPGQDLSEQIMKSPHKKNVLSKLTIVGKLA